MSFYTCEYCNKQEDYMKNGNPQWKIISFFGHETLFCSLSCLKKYCKEMD